MTREVLKLALEALYALAAMNHTTQQMKSNTINAIKKALAQPEQEPAADDFFKTIADKNPKPFPLPQRPRVVFPTMLRKMWSGGEVQAWLDENVNKENT